MKNVTEFKPLTVDIFFSGNKVISTVTTTTGGSEEERISWACGKCIEAKGLPFNYEYIVIVDGSKAYKFSLISPINFRLYKAS